VEEKLGIYIASSGVLTQIYSIPPADANGSARVSFLTAILDSDEQLAAILLSRTDLGTNPLTQPLLDSLSSMSNLEGSGILLDENGRILYHPDPGLIMREYSGLRGSQPAFYDNTAPDGTRELAYYQPVSGRPWAVVLSIPARQAQQLALNIATPLSLMILILAFVAMVTLRIGLGVITGSLQNLANEAVRISQGQLDYPLQGLRGVDEVGQLRHAFEQMRIGLKDRMEELNRLLLVSMGTAASLQIQDSVKPVLDAALATGASSARVILSPDIIPENQTETPSHFALGSNTEKIAHLDDQIMLQSERQEILIITNLARGRGLNIDPSLERPGALLAVALRHENRFLGVLWAAYDQPRLFSDADARFMTTLANQTALAASNAYLFMSVEVGRQQLEAILASTPDPVLVTDHRNRLVLANPAAQQVFGATVVSGAGRTIQRLVDQKPLLDLLQASSTEKQSAEIAMPGGQTYLATASSVLAEGRPVGRVCILRDVTHFKELDTLKSEFVATVSPDLRSPLTLMRGYATMLEMVGELNDQQQGYVRKIISGVENMSRLVNNLLDLGRIDLGVGLQVETIPLLDILDRVVSPLQSHASQKEIELTSEPAADLPILIEADQALLHQAVYNLVENAIKYTPQGGKVVVRLSSLKNSVLFAVQDTGYGITPEDKPRLFEKFFRGRQREARAQHGTGLGLAIVRSIVERHGGRVWLESEVGKGSTFYLQVPVQQPKGRR
jgi:PAS domain S-box-containing protein